MYMLDTSESLETCAAELSGAEVGQLITPLTGFSNRGGPFAIDNGAFAGFNANRFRAIINRERPNRSRCVFVAVPDVVGSARRTLEVFSHWYPKLSGWPLAYVCQNGQQDVEIPWRLIDAIFVGGTNEIGGDWKLSRHAEACIRAAQAIGKWVHIGRVNGPDRIEHFKDMGVDSIDGTGVSLYTHMRKRAVTSPLRLPFNELSSPARETKPSIRKVTEAK